MLSGGVIVVSLVFCARAAEAGFLRTCTSSCKSSCGSNPNKVNKSNKKNGKKKTRCVSTCAADKQLVKTGNSCDPCRGYWASGSQRKLTLDCRKQRYLRGVLWFVVQNLEKGAMIFRIDCIGPRLVGGEVVVCFQSGCWVEFDVEGWWERGMEKNILNSWSRSSSLSNWSTFVPASSHFHIIIVIHLPLWHDIIRFLLDGMQLLYFVVNWPFLLPMCFSNLGKILILLGQADDYDFVGLEDLYWLICYLTLGKLHCGLNWDKIKLCQNQCDFTTLCGILI